jgi:hypothetical protein
MMSLLARMRLADQKSPRADEELKNAISGLRHRMPELQKQFEEVSRVETRQYFRERGLKSPSMPGVGELYLLKPPEQVWEGVERYGIKLAKALHYFHTGQIVPQTAAVLCKTVTAGNQLKAGFPHELIALFPGRPELKRESTSLDDQFSYQFGVLEGGVASGFWVKFGDNLAMLLAVFMDGAAYEERNVIRRRVKGDGTLEWQPASD